MFQRKLCTYVYKNDSKKKSFQTRNQQAAAREYFLTKNTFFRKHKKKGFAIKTFN